ncbi:MAG: hypothetical protein IPI91_20845 [Flavobacteriales bacterium]|nr:hypothetical protein [Flavobacteriales bacterium]
MGLRTMPRGAKVAARIGMKTLLRKTTSPGISVVTITALLIMGCSNADNNSVSMNDRDIGLSENVMADSENFEIGNAAPADQVPVHFDTRLYTEEGGLIIRKEANTREPATTPAEERSYLAEDLHIPCNIDGRVGPCEDRLNLGGREEPSIKADEKRATELAKSLDRVDRALAVIEASTDSTWKSERERQLKELKVVREWVMRYRAVRPTSSTSRM